MPPPNRHRAGRRPPPCDPAARVPAGSHRPRCGWGKRHRRRSTATRRDRWSGWRLPRTPPDPGPRPRPPQGRDPPAADPDPAVDAAGVLDLVVSSVAASPTNDRVWLLLTAVGAAYPTRSEVDAIRRELELLDRTAAVISLLDAGLAAVSAEGDPDAVIDIVSGGVIVDVDHGAKHELHTGIQQVTRSLLPIWTSKRDVVPAAWTRSAGSLRRLS